MKTLKKIITVLLIIFLSACYLIPLIFWGCNSELTEMQIFIKFWPLFLLGIIDGFLLFKFLD